MYLNSKILGIVSFFVCLGAMLLKFSLPQIILLCGLLVVVSAVIEMYLTCKRSKDVVALLHDHVDPEGFLSELNKDEKIYKEKRIYDLYLMNRSAGLFYLGRWQEALEIINAIHFEKLPKMQKYFYLNNTLANLLGSGQIRQAEDLLNEHRALLEVFPKNSALLELHWKCNCAWLDLCRGELLKSRGILQRSLTGNVPRSLKVMSYYLLGLIDLKEAKPGEARDNFLKALEFGSKTFIKDSVQKYL